MAQPSISSLEDLHTRWGPPPPTLDAATITYLCNGLTLERNSSRELGLRRRQGWKMAQQVLTEVAAVLVPSTTTAPSSPKRPVDDEQVHTPLPKCASTAAGRILTPESLDRHQYHLDVAGYDKNKSYSAYLDMLMTPDPTATERKATKQTSSSPSSSSSSITTTTTDDDSASTIPSSPLAPTQTSPTPKHPRPATPPTTNSDQEEKERDTAKTLHPLLLARLNAAWSNLLDLDLASRSVEHRVARDLGALRRLRGAALDELLEELVVVRGYGYGGSPGGLQGGGGEEGGEEGEWEGGEKGEWEGGEKGGEKEEKGEEREEGLVDGQYTAAMRALGKRFGEAEEVALEEEGVRGLDWEELGRARESLENELVARGVLEYESE